MCLVLLEGLIENLREKSWVMIDDLISYGIEGLPVKTYHGFYMIYYKDAIGYIIGGWEEYEVNHWLLPNAKGVVVDIGAHFGRYYTLLTAKKAEKVITI